MQRPRSVFYEVCTQAFPKKVAWANQSTFLRASLTRQPFINLCSVASLIEQETGISRGPKDEDIIIGPGGDCQ